MQDDVFFTNEIILKGRPIQKLRDLHRGGHSFARTKTIEDFEFQEYKWLHIISMRLANTSSGQESLDYLCWFVSVHSPSINFVLGHELAWWILQMVACCSGTEVNKNSEIVSLNGFHHLYDLTVSTPLRLIHLKKNLKEQRHVWI